MDENHETLMMMTGIIGENQGSDGDKIIQENLNGLRGRRIILRGAVVLIGRVTAHQIIERGLPRKIDGLHHQIRDRQRIGSRRPT